MTPARSTGGTVGAPAPPARPRARALLAAALALVSAAPPAPAASAARAAAPSAAVVLELQPRSGPAGAAVSVTGQLSAAGPRDGLPPDQAVACWVTCGPGGLRLSADVTWSDRRFTLRLQAPVFLWRSGLPALLGPGRYALLLACLRRTAPGCEAHPDARAAFALTAAAPATPWRALPRARTWYPLQPADYPGFALAPGRIPRVAECADDPRSGRPLLRVSTDLGRTWGVVPLPPYLLGEQPAGVVGCRALALDPQSATTFYVAGAGNRATARPQFAAPPPLYTTDGGRHWQMVPVPLGFSAGWGWTGFSTSAAGVVAWFSRAYFGQPLTASMFAEEVSLQGGSAWIPVPLICPSAGPCAWRAAGLNPALNGAPAQVGVVISRDGGKTWRWARFAGMALSGGAPATDGRALLWSDALAWPDGTEGEPGAGITAPLLYSPDAGAHWEWVALPPPPPGWANPGELRVLPDGALLLHVWGGAPSGWLLRPGAGAWCALSGAVPAHGLYLELGTDLVWLGGSGVRLEAAAALRCGG